MKHIKYLLVGFGTMGVAFGVGAVVFFGLKIIEARWGPNAVAAVIFAPLLIAMAWNLGWVLDE